MSDIITHAVDALNAKLPDGFDGSAKFDIEGEGSILLGPDGAQASDAEADVTMRADADTFQAILEGDMNPTMAFMSGKLAIEGDMSVAMALGSALS